MSQLNGPEYVGFSWGVDGGWARSGEGGWKEKEQRTLVEIQNKIQKINKPII